MKKEYKKPRLYAESFELVEHIAVGCKVDAELGVTANFSYDNARSNGSCYFEDGNIRLYINGDYCTVLMEDAGDIFCYNSFTEEASMFSS